MGDSMEDTEPKLSHKEIYSNILTHNLAYRRK